MKKLLLLHIAVSLLSINALAQKKPVTTEDVWRYYRFFDRGVGGLNSMQDGLHYTIMQGDDKGVAIEKYSYLTGEKVETVLHSSTLSELLGRPIQFDSYAFGPNEKSLLLEVDRESIYRHSSKSKVYIYNLVSKSIDSLTNGSSKQQLAAFSPARAQVAYVENNRMHIRNLGSDAAWNTLDFGRGEEDAFIAGALDWVYEEEFSFDKGFEWSTSGDEIAYFQFDERKVPLFSMDIYGSALYPSAYEFKYPKAGEANSEVHIEIFNLSSQKSRKVNIPEAYEYIPRIKYDGNDNLYIFTLNRHQNDLAIWKVKAGSSEATLHYRERASAYLEITDDLQFLADGSFVYTSEMDGWRHIYHIGKNGKKIKQLTSGQWEVSTLYGVDEKEGLVYFQAGKEHPTKREIYRVNLKGKKLTKISTGSGWSDADFSSGFQYFINTHSSASSPNMVSLHRGDGKLIRKLEDNEKLRERLAQYELSPKEFLSIPVEEGVELNAWMIKPQNFDSSKAYPVLMFVYGGPGSQTVKDAYDGGNSAWYQALANMGYIVVSVDNRGTGARGRDFRTITYKQLGKVEIADQIAAAKWLGQQSYVDAERMGIWGWSYGGYMSSLGITKGADVFKLAIAVAPVTNWRFYDSIYTERYMQTPQENGSGYDDNSPINHVEKLEGHYLLVHGSADDNVHFQNTTRMISALVEANAQFDLFVYPDKNHGIYGGNTRYHLYTKMTDFITENL